MRAVYRREIYSYYTTPQGYVFTGAFVLVLNLFFYFANIQGRVSALGAVFAFMLTVLMVTVPMLTMRLFSEEYRRGTDRLLFSAPVRPRSVVMGKLWAAMTVFAVSLLVSLIWVEIIVLFGGFNLAEYLGNMVAILTFAAVYVTIGLLVSALTGSQTVAMTATLGVFAAMFLADVAVNVMPDTAVKRFLASFSLFARYDSFSRGVFSVTDLVFCVSACAFFLFLTTMVLHRRRQGLKGGWGRFAAVAVPALALLAAANLFVNELDSRLYLKIDMTKNGVFTLSEESSLLLKELPEQVIVTMLTPLNEMTGVVYDDATGAGYQLTDLREALEKIQAAANRNFTLQFIDPDLNPAWIQARDLSNQAGYYSLIVESARRTRVLTLRDLFQTQTLYDMDEMPVQEMAVGLNVERAVMSAVLNVITETLPTAVIIEGHAEYPLNTFEELLKTSGFDVQRVNLAASPLPDNTTLAVLAAPQYDLSAEELNNLDRYMSGGGHSLIALDPELPPLQNLEQYLAEWGVRFESAYVCDSDVNYGSPDLLLTGVEDTRLTQLAGTDSRYLLVAGARPLTLLWETDGNRVTTPLFYSRGTSYAKELRDDRLMTGLEREAEDASGSFVLGAVCEQVRPDGSGSYAFFVPLSVLADTALELPNFMNRPLTVHWLSLIQPDLIVDILPRDMTDVPLVLDSRETSVLFILLVIAMPLMIFGTGAAVWLRRRKL